MDNLPRVSCIMPTYNRRRFVPLAVRYFLHQDYPNKELIIVDDGTDPVADLIPPDPRIRYLRLAHRARVGAKRNLACESSRASIIAHWDDDDWAARNRLSLQVEALLGTGVALCGARALLHFDPETTRAWRFTYPEDGRNWLVGSSLCYARELWVGRPFLDMDVGEDAHFVLATPRERTAALTDLTFQVGILHRQNVSGKQPRTRNWQPYPVGKIRALLGPDWAAYTAWGSTRRDPRRQLLRWLRRRW